MGTKRAYVFRHLAVVSLGLVLSIAAFASVTYVAKPGDKLSKIAGKMIQGPVWGKHGSWQSVLALNSEIKNPDLIYVGQEIKLPDGEVAQAAESSSEQRAPAAEEAAPLASPTPALSSPTPLLAAPLEKENSHGSLLELAPYYALTSISSTDKITGSPASAASSLNAGVDLRFSQPWSESFSSFVHFKLGALSFEQPTDSSKSVQSASNLMSGIGLGGDFKLSQALTFRIFGDYQKEAFIRGVSTDTVAIDAVSVPEVGASLVLDLFKKNSLTLGVSGQFSELFQAATEGYTVSQGSLFGGKVYFKRDSCGSAFQTDLGYFSRQQDTNLTNQTERDLILQLRWEFH
jgi:LysM repeat protein